MKKELQKNGKFYIIETTPRQYSTEVEFYEFIPYNKIMRFLMQESGKKIYSTSLTQRIYNEDYTLEKVVEMFDDFIKSENNRYDNLAEIARKDLEIELQLK